MSDNDTHESRNSTRGTDRRTFLKSGLAAAGVVPLWLSSTETAAAQTDPLSLIDQMSIKEKVYRVTGQYGFIVETGYIPPNEDLGVPDVRLSDGPLGLRRGPQTAFPASILAASSFNYELVNQEGSAIGRESRANDQDVHLAPAMNIVRVPQLGRCFEYYGEDPAVTGEMASAFATGVQSEGIIATGKHFALNNQEKNRQNVSAEVSERAMREIYLAGFRKVVQEGNVGAIMAAYNRVHGTYATENSMLLEEILKDDWGFEGFVMSDWGAVHSTVGTANNGLDVEMPGENSAFGTPYWGDDLVDAVNNGEVSEETINDKVERLFRELDRFGKFDQSGDTPSVDYDRSRSVAQDLAEDGSVLLKNEGDVLPLDASSIDELAVVGIRPARFRIGGGGSSDVVPQRRIGPIEGVQETVGDEMTINAVEGDDNQPLDVSHVTLPNSDENGFAATYYDNPNFEGDPAATATEKDNLLFAADIESYDGVSIDGGFSGRWKGTLTSPVTGSVTFALESVSTTRLFVDGTKVVENEGGFFGSSTTTEGSIDLEEGQTYDIEIEVVGNSYTDEAYLRAGWNRPDVDPMRLAADSASSADAAIVIGKGYSSEGSDREDISLGNGQNELISTVADANDNTVVLLNTGGPVVMPWIEQVPSVLELWYPGQEGGHAAANLLFGETNPSGKLPVTFGKSVYDYPANDPDSDRTYPGVNDFVYYDEGVFVGYRHFDEQDIEPLFPFGHGESYTSFEYSGLTVSKRNLAVDGSLTVSVKVTNTGDRDGAEVVQVYVGEEDPAVERPPKELAGFAKETIPAGETKRISMELGLDAFQYWDPETERWTIDPGKFRVIVGSSSRDIRGERMVNVRGPPGSFDDDSKRGRRQGKRRHPSVR